MIDESETTRALRVMAVFYRAAVTDILIHDYHWRGTAAERFADRLMTETAAMAGREARLRRELNERQLTENTETHES